MSSSGEWNEYLHCAVDSEHHCEWVAPDHPLPVLNHVAFANTVQGDSGRDRPAKRLHGVARDRSKRTRDSQRHEHREWGRDEDARHIQISKNAMQPAIMCSQMVGKLEWRYEHGQGSEERMNRQEPNGRSVVLR